MTIHVKFALFILIGGIIPIALLATIGFDTMFTVYQESLEDSYMQEFQYSIYAMDSVLETYNNLSKYPYYYVPSGGDNIIRASAKYDNLYYILSGQAFPEAMNSQLYIVDGMNSFLNNLLISNSDISALHFLHEETEDTRIYHMGSRGMVFASEVNFASEIDLESIDKESKKLQLFPVHQLNYMGYLAANQERVITIGRNYFISSGGIINQIYIGTLLIDMKVESLEKIFSTTNYVNHSKIYLYDTWGLCLYSSEEEVIGTILETEGFQLNQEGEMSFMTEYFSPYGIYLTVQLDTIPLSEQMVAVQYAMYVFVLLSIVALLGSSFFFSGRITKPIRALMRQMGQVEKGEFIDMIPVTNDDEIGQLTARFNQMTEELKLYTNQVYVAKIQQKEAELDALKSQIYPHFLYNTLEVIRMTALSQEDHKVAQMIEALSDQIRYLIGTVSDIVPLSLEIDILQKYIYLVNCRYDYQVEFVAEDGGFGALEIPKLILQPLIENAFVHGVKPKKIDGAISLYVTKGEERLEIAVMDNGCGMSEGTVQEIKDLLASEEPGKKEEYQWSSIGLKNVHDRLRFLYGEEYGLSISSTLDLGTAVTVSLPLNIVERDGKYVEDDISR